jgi:carboxypeptidase Q
MRTSRLLSLGALACAIALGGTALAWQAPPEAAQAPAGTKATPAEIDKIKDEGLNRSEVMKTLSYLSDVIGPRLTASPQMKRANEWTRDTLTKWGLENAHLESWGPFGRGWELKRFSAQVVEPQCIPLIAFPKAWSPGLDEPVTGDVVHFTARDENEFEKFQGKLKGAIVLIGSERELKAWFDPPGVRLTDERLLNLANAPEPAPRTGGRRPPRREGPPRDAAPPQPTFLQKRMQFLIDEGAALIMEPSFRGDGGTLFVMSAMAPGSPGQRVSVWDKDAPKILPQVVCSIEHFNRLLRMLDQGEPVRMTVDLKVAFHDDDAMAYNTVAEIPGTDLKDEIVMLGGHMDSWHGGTGATDNAAGVAACMEAVRILKALDLKPRRTVRIALWSGEEQGLFGSRAYVRQHFGEFEGTGQSENESMAVLFGGGAGRTIVAKPDYEKFSAYFNLDNGTGKIRGVYMEGNEAVRPIFRRWLQPFRDTGAATLTISPTFGTDHQAFDAIGLPGFQFIQDPIEYETRTHHSNQDVFDRIQADDMKQASTILATFVYQAAMMDEKLPRKPAPGPIKPAESSEAEKSEKAEAGSGGR